MCDFVLAGAVFRACVRLRDEAHDLLDGHHQNAEHQMAEHLGRPAHAHAVAAAIILEVAVDALGRTALVVKRISSASS